MLKYHKLPLVKLITYSNIPVVSLAILIAL